MPVFYIESSSLFKRYRTETGTDVVNAVFGERKDDDRLVTSHLATVEMESASSRGLKGKILNRRAHGIIIRLFAEDLGAMIVLPVSSATMNEAALAARRHALRALDAIHFASTLRASQSAPDSFAFVASDKHLVRAARNAGFVTINPEEPEALPQLKELRGQ